MNPWKSYSKLFKMQSKIIALSKISYIKKYEWIQLFCDKRVQEKTPVTRIVHNTTTSVTSLCVSLINIFKSAHLKVTHGDLHVLASFVCMGLFIHAPPPLIKPACTTARKRNASPLVTRLRCLLAPMHL